MSREVLLNIYTRLYERYGPQHWWPGQTRFEIIVGAILTQNTNWGNVEKAIHNLNEAMCLSPEKLHILPINQLAELIRPAGYFNIKAQRLKNFLNWLFEKYDGSLDTVEQINLYDLREELLSIKGIGPETADSICLYAFEKPVFVVDAYTARILGRHQLIEAPSGYEQIQDLFHSSLRADTKLFNEFHALLVRLGKEHCKPRPQCHCCPLEDLPHEIDIDL